MKIDKMVQATRQLYEPVDVAVYVLKVALQETVGDADVLQRQIDELERAVQMLNHDARLTLGHVLEQRLNELHGSGAFSGRVPLIRRLTIVESHIIHDALVDGGIDARIRREHVSAADVLHPTTGAEIWVRPHELADARALIDKLDSSSDAKQQCPACHEENPGHFKLCWNCNHHLDGMLPSKDVDSADHSAQEFE